MLAGIYRATMGMRAGLEIQDVLANNLANASTTAYKRKVPVYADVHADNMGAQNNPNINAPTSIPPRPPMLAPAAITLDDGVAYVATSVTRSNSRIDYSAGQPRPTGNQLDLFLEGGGFFTLQAPDGRMVYTRAGNFRPNNDGDLVSAQGYTVLSDQNAPINVTGGDPAVTQEGDVIVDGQLRGRLLITNMENPQMAQEIEGGFVTTAQGQGIPAADTMVRQGYLETSNVNVVAEMVTMISTLRAYEAAQRAIAAGDQMLGKAANEIGRLA